MKFNVNRMGEQYQAVNLQWLASITTTSEHKKIEALNVGGKIEFKRDVTGPVGATKLLVVERVS